MSAANRKDASTDSGDAEGVAGRGRGEVEVTRRGAQRAGASPTRTPVTPKALPDEVEMSEESLADPPAPIDGAEARILATDFLGRAVLAKHRIPRPYRHPRLDARLRDERTRDEAHLLLAARRAGVPVPIVYDADRASCRILLERIEGSPLRFVLESDPDDVAAARFTALGRIVARLHDAGITHGDLTTSNLLVPDAADPGSIVLIDFGLGQSTPEHEQRAVDLHLLEEALEATEARAEALMAACLAAYSEHAADAEATLRRLEAVRERGRYRGAS